MTNEHAQAHAAAHARNNGQLPDDDLFCTQEIRARKDCRPSLPPQAGGAEPEPEPATAQPRSEPGTTIRPETVASQPRSEPAMTLRSETSFAAPPRVEASSLSTSAGEPFAAGSAETSTISTISTGVGAAEAGEGGGISTISTISTGVGAASADEDSGSAAVSSEVEVREHPIPEDSLLADYRDFIRKVSELPDGLIIAPVLALCGKLLTPKVMIDFGVVKPVTIYNFMAATAGKRKSTTLAPAEKIARLILESDGLIAGNASDSALFDTFECQPHRLQFEDEGNTIMQSWETSAYGREVSARYLKLYDGAPWSQNFRRESKSHEDGKAERHIPQATLSLCIASTYNVAKMDQLAAGSGLRRRFGFYVTDLAARDIWWPRSLNGEKLAALAERFRALTTLQGVVGEHSLTPAAMDYWISLQKRNRARCNMIPGYTHAEEDLLSSLNESPMRCLKLAVIFQACRWARGSISDPLTITPDVLEIAEAHQNACLDALVQVERWGRMCGVDDTAEWLLAQIAGDNAGKPGKRSAVYTKTELTRRFAANPGRAGALTPSRLYTEIIPHLISKGRCEQRAKVGNRVSYSFHWD